MVSFGGMDSIGIEKNIRQSFGMMAVSNGLDMVFKSGHYKYKIYSNANQYWRWGEYYHRENGPAIIWADGAKSWYEFNLWIRSEYR